MDAFRKAPQHTAFHQYFPYIFYKTHCSRLQDHVVTSRTEGERRQKSSFDLLSDFTATLEQPLFFMADKETELSLMLLVTPVFTESKQEGKSIHRDAALCRQLGLTQEPQVGRNHRNERKLS